MTNYFDVYQDARRKLNPRESLNYVISDVKNNHPTMRHYYSKDTMAIVNSLVESAHKLERCIVDLRDASDNEHVKNCLLKIREEAFKHLSFYLGEEVILKFMTERFENLN